MTDFIIIGAGSSGCVLASELSANPNHQVLVIESGPLDTSFLIEMPRGIGKLLSPDNEHVWSYDINKGKNLGQETWLKGRTLGGSSSVNGMVYARGFPSDYNRWETEWGCKGWNWKAMLPHFVAHEDHEFGANEQRGIGGPLHITGHPVNDTGRDAKELCEAFLDAAQQAGTPRVKDTNTAVDGGAGYQPRNIWQGRRQSAAKVFLHPAMSRPNLKVLTKTDVLRIIFEGKKAVGVEVRDETGTRIIRCHKEVILSAGAIESPKLLQLSGVGPSEKLLPLGIDVIHDLPQVGQNLREHYYVSVTFRVTKGSLNKEFQGLSLLKNMVRYMLKHKGPMANAAQEIIGYIKTREGLERPDCQIGAGLYTIGKGPKGPVLEKELGLTIGGYHMHPQSQGEMYITSNDPAVKPYIQANYLEHTEDKDASVALIRYIRKIAQQSAISPYIVEELAPGIDIQDYDNLLHAYHELGSTAFHVSGTCRMGGDEYSVVDPQTRVRGVQGVRVVDTSIFPELISGNTNAPAMAAGRHAAKMILAAYS